MERYTDHLHELLPCDVSSDLPGLKTVRLVPDGNVKGRSKPFVIDAEAAAAIVADFAAHGTPLVIDYEHQTLGGEYAAPDGKAPAAGWVTKIWHEPGRGIMGLVSWNAKARDLIRAQEYVYLSPVLAIRHADGRAVRLHSAGLTNVPAIASMEKLAATAKKPDPFMEEVMTPDATNDVGGRLSKIGEFIKRDLSGDVGAALDTLWAWLQEHFTSGDSEVASSVRTALKLDPKADGAAVLAAMKQGVETELSAMKAELEALRSKDADEEIHAFLEPYTSCGAVFNRYSKGERERAEYERFYKLAKADRELAKFTLERMKYLMPAQGKTNPPTQRQMKMTEAERKFKEDPKLSRLTSLRAFTNQLLADAGMQKLSDEEAQTLAVV